GPARSLIPSTAALKATRHGRQRAAIGTLSGDGSQPVWSARPPSGTGDGAEVRSHRGPGHQPRMTCALYGLITINPTGYLGQSAQAHDCLVPAKLGRTHGNAGVGAVAADEAAGQIAPDPAYERPERAGYLQGRLGEHQRCECDVVCARSEQDCAPV